MDQNETTIQEPLSIATTKISDEKYRVLRNMNIRTVFHHFILFLLLLTNRLH